MDGLHMSHSIYPKCSLPEQLCLYFHLIQFLASVCHELGLALRVVEFLPVKDLCLINGQEQLSGPLAGEIDKSLKVWFCRNLTHCLTAYGSTNICGRPMNVCDFLSSKVMIVV